MYDRSGRTSDFAGGRNKPTRTASKSSIWQFTGRTMASACRVSLATQLVFVGVTAIAVAQGPPPMAPKPPAPAPSPEAIKRAEQTLAEVHKALGGDKLSSLKTLVASGQTRRVRGNNLVPIEFEISIEMPDKYLR